MSTPFKTTKENNGDETWNEICASFIDDGYTEIKNSNPVVKEELLSIFESLQRKSSKMFSQQWDAFCAKKDRKGDDGAKHPGSENVEEFRAYVKELEIQRNELAMMSGTGGSNAANNENNSNNKSKNRFMKQQEKKKQQRIMTMGEALESDYQKDGDCDAKMEVISNIEQPSKSGANNNEEEEPKTPFKEINNNPLSAMLKTPLSSANGPGSYRKKKKSFLDSTTTTTTTTTNNNNNNNNNDDDVKTIFKGGSSSIKCLEKNVDDDSNTISLFTEISTTADFNNNNNNNVVFMRDRIEDKVALLKDKFSYFEQDLLLINEQEEEEQEQEQEGDDRNNNKNSMKLIGRICENQSDQGFEIETIEGLRVKLELRDCQNSYSLFPGQLVKCFGANPSGHCFVAKEIDCYCLSSSEASAKKEKTTIKTKNTTTNILCFSGPFTASDDFLYEPLDDVLEYSSSSSSSSNINLILLGPFVSEDHVSSDMTFKQAFEHVVMKKIQAFAKQNPNARVILVPSAKDAFHRFSAFPQPAFNNNNTNNNKNIHFVANPCVFEINGIRICATTCDILKHLSASERGGKGKSAEDEQTIQQVDRMTKLCSHLIGQKSVYPLFPAHVDAKFESYKSNSVLKVAMDEKIPDLILLTSDLAPGGWKNALSGNKTMFVNPGKACRGVNAGTFAKIVYTDEQQQQRENQCFAKDARLELHKL